MVLEKGRLVLKIRE